MRRQLASAKTEEPQANLDLSESKNENKRLVCVFNFSLQMHVLSEFLYLNMLCGFYIEV